MNSDQEFYQATDEELEVLTAYWQEQWEVANTDMYLHDAVKEKRQSHANSRLFELLRFLGEERQRKACQQGTANFIRKYDVRTHLAGKTTIKGLPEFAPE